MKNIEVTFPVISNLKMDVSKAFGMLKPAASSTQAVRAVFIIDPKAVVRAILYYPLSNGRNMDEIKRLLIAMQHSDEHGITTPANWQIGDDVIVPPPGSQKSVLKSPPPTVSSCYTSLIEGRKVEYEIGEGKKGSCATNLVPA